MAKQIVVKVDEDFHRRFKAKAASRGRTLTDVVRELLEAWLDADDTRASADDRRGAVGEEDHGREG